MKLLMKVILGLACLPAGMAFSQEGFPLDGTWRGEWGVSDDAMTRVVMVMEWDGQAVNGRINPGRNMLLFEGGTLDADSWGVHIEASSKDEQSIVIQGVLENIGSYQRTITGTWTLDGQVNQISLSRE
jgi:hypothetical protein